MKQVLISFLAFCLMATTIASVAGDIVEVTKDDGYRGIWYEIPPRKYGGGLGTYPQWLLPMAHYVPEVDKTFFCYGGTIPGKRELLHMVSYYDHKTGLVPRPGILLNKATNDAHDNPTMTITDDGIIYIFSNSHGTSRPSYIHRSVEPYSVEKFEKVFDGNFSYGQPWYVPGEGILFLHTRYSSRGRELHWMTSRDGETWSEPQLLASFAGHYQLSWQLGNKIGTAFDYHPRGLDNRTNIYYLETSDFGQTWQDAAGNNIEIPQLNNKDGLVHDYDSKGLLVYLKSLTYDADGHPVIVYLTSKGHLPGPENGPRVWYTARWDGSDWVIRRITWSGHNYDHGELTIEADGTWHIIAPIDPGPHPDDTGGEMVMWVSKDQGMTWRRGQQVTRNSPMNHTYARRPVNAHPDFYAYWADGNPTEFSDSVLYFSNRDGDKVWRLPPIMSRDMQAPELAYQSGHAVIKIRE